MRRSISVDGDAAPDVVWERYASLRHWRLWAPQIRWVEPAGHRLAPELSGLVHGPAGLRVSFVVEEVDERARTWRWRVRQGPLQVTMEHGVFPTASGGTTATLALDGPAVVALAYPVVAQLALRRLVSP